MQKLDNSLISSLLTPNTKFNTLKPSSSENVNSVSRPDSIDLRLTPKASIATSVVYQSVSSKYSSSNTALSNAMEQQRSQPSAIFDAQKVAETIMTFVSDSLAAAKENGATDAELEEMFAQAKSGVNQGIDEALFELDDANILNSDLSEGIEKSRSLIGEEIDKLQQQYFPDSENSAVLSTSQQQINSIERFNASSQSSELTIKTRDGDIVKIAFSQNKEQYNYTQYNNGNTGQSERAGFEQISASNRQLNFSFSVKGDLDEEELTAIHSLINDVNELQQQFFSGDIESAFDKAMSLGIDSDRLSSYSIDLQQTQTTYVSKQYQEVASLADDLLPSLAEQLSPLIEFIDQYDSLKEKASQQFALEGKEFSQMLTNIYDAAFTGNDTALQSLSKMINTLEGEN